ncbi:MAG TPA: class I SAM-dependent methyltransferase [Streptosporangiaceae bacterium]
MRAPTPRRAAHLGLLGSGAAIAASAALLAADAITTAVAVTVIFGMAILAVGAVLLAVAVRVEHEIAPSLRRVERQGDAGEARAAALAASVEHLGARVDAGRTAASEELLTVYRQLEALIDLRGLIGPRAPMPPLRGWALSPDALRLIVGQVLAREPQLIVECGSGSSSIWLGYAVQRLGTGRVVALEHQESFAAATRELTRAHGLAGVVEVRYAPLVPWCPDAQWAGAGGQPWYDRRAVADLEKIGLLLVDGPPAGTAEAARYPAVPVLLPRCAEDALIVLDDTVRSDEAAISDRWLAEYPELRRTVYELEKGLHVFERAAPV